MYGVKHKHKYYYESDCIDLNKITEITTLLINDEPISNIQTIITKINKI